MAKAPKAKAPKSITFFGHVTVSGNVDEGTAEVIITQALPERPERPPIEPPVEPPIEPPDTGNGFFPPTYLRTDVNKVAIPSAPRPPYLTPWRDPVFGTRIIRVSGDPGSAITNISGGRWGQARHHYSSDQAWNCDETLLFLDTNEGGTPSDLLLDGQSYTPISGVSNKPSSSDVRWHPTEPELMLAASGSKLLTWNPRSGQQRVLATFNAFSDLTFGPWEGSPSRDGNRVVLTSDDRGVAFVYDMLTGYKHPDIAAAAIGGDMDSCRISRAGNYMVWGINPDVVVVTDLAGKTVHKLPDNYVSHFDVTVDEEGNEVVVGRVNSSSVGQGASGLVSKYRLKDGLRTGLQAAKGWSSHTSCRSSTFYCVADGTLEGGDYIYNGELIMCDLAGGIVYRLCHTHTQSEVEYLQQTQPSHAPSGGRVIFASPWGNSTGVGCYVVDFRE